MKRNVDISPHQLSPHRRPRTRLGLASGAVVISFGLVGSACANDGITFEAPTTTAPAVVTTDSPSTTEPNGVDEIEIENETENATEIENAEIETEAETDQVGADAVDDVDANESDEADVDIDAEAAEVGLGEFLDQLEDRGFGGVVAVREGDEITTRAYDIADRENDVSNDIETVFDIGSLTKQFTAAAILRLEMDGRLSVDDALGEHVPGLPDEMASLTLHQLLTHTAGVPHGFGPDDEPINRADFLARVGVTPLIAAPGERYEYSNIGYALLAAVIEFETGAPYERYVRTALFEPAGMLDTGYVIPDWAGHTIAVGYDDATGDRFGRPNEQPWDVDGPYWNLLGNGGLMSTAADMLRWDQALLGDQVLDATAREKLFAAHVPDAPAEGVAYGYGWVIVPTPMGTPLITHGGANGIFYADFLRFVDQEVTVFLATNSSRDDDGSVAFDVANHVLDGRIEAMADDAEPDDDGGVEDVDSDGGNDVQQGDDGVDGAALNCGFGELSIDTLPDYPEIGTPPDSAAGRTAELLLDVLFNGDAAARLDFATDHVAVQLGGDDPAAIARDIATQQPQFVDTTIGRVLQQDDHHFHVFLHSSDRDLVLSIGFDANDPERLACFALSD